jgi:hypothetical protein
LSIVHAVVPPRTRRWLRATYDAWRFDAALRRFAADPERALADGSDVLDELISAWGNAGWCAQREYLRNCIGEALRTDGPSLECGSGLSTLLLGAVAERRGFEHWALEHQPEWSARVEREAARHGLHRVHVCTVPLRQHGHYAWYDAPLARMPRHFSLVVCDGPPGDTPGGRYGLVPVMGDRMPPGCVVLLDDAQRDQERAIARRWQVELGATHDLIAGSKPFVRMVVTGRPAAALRKTG